MKRRAFTLAELMVVIGIVSLLATISYPVLTRAVEAAKITRSKSNIKQLHLAIMMYCDSQDGEGPNMLGLPPTWGAFEGDAKLPLALLRTGGSSWQHPEAGNGGDAYTWMVPNVAPGFPGFSDGPGTERDVWRKHVANTQGNPILLLDATFPGQTGWMQTKRVFGIYHNGTLATKRYPGSVTYHKQWEPR